MRAALYAGAHRTQDGMGVEKSNSKLYPHLLERRLQDCAQRAEELRRSTGREIFRSERLVAAANRSVASSQQRVGESQKLRRRSRALRQQG